MAATDLRRQFLTEHSQLLSFWRANVRREVAADGGAPPLWSIENQRRKLAGGQPWETAAIVSPTEGQAPVAVEAVPAQVRDLEKFAAHGLHWVPEERLYFTDLDRHVRIVGGLTRVKRRHAMYVKRCRLGIPALP